MKKFTTWIPVIFLCLLVLSECKKQNTLTEISSPGKTNTLQFELVEGVPYYSVKHGNLPVVDPSQLGFIFQDADTLASGFALIDAETSTFDETWEQVWGEKRFIRNHYNQLTVTLQESKGQKRKLAIQFRAFDDGVAFRYLFPEQGIGDSLFIMDEITGFSLSDPGDAWWIPAYHEQRYENLYRKSAVSELRAVHTPLTLKSNSGLYLSIHEADLVNYASMVLEHDSGNRLTCDLVPWADGIKVKTKAPFQTPWRTIQIAETPGDLITSYLILNLNEPNKLEDTSWIKPHKYLGIWWGMHIGKYTFWESPTHGASTKNAQRYIDYCEELGIDHLLIEGWNKGWTPNWYQNAMHRFDFTTCTDDFNLVEVDQYADSKGIKLIGYHETGSNLINYLKQIDDGMALYRQRGIHDIKIGQVGSKLNMKEWHHGQFGVNYYRYVLKKAAEYQLTVNFHEPIKDTGERRTWPHMVSREGGRGMEYDAWSAGNPPNHYVILPFTRMLAGPMDFTPGIFDIDIEQGYGRTAHSTVAKQLACYVILYSPIQMLADLPEYYTGNPAFKFLQDVPVDWEDTHILNGEIGEYITTIRKDRNSDDWYLGSMTNEKAREFEIPLSFLDEGASYEAQMYADAPGTTWQRNPEEVALSTIEVTNARTLKVKLGEGGGLAVRFKKTNR
jgi:alpha-glucosidase